MHDLRVRHPRRRGNRHDVTGAEQREARIEQRLLGSVRHDDVVGIDRPATGQEREMRGGGGAELEEAFSGRVVGLAVIYGAEARLLEVGRWWEIGLAGSQ